MKYPHVAFPSHSHRLHTRRDVNECVLRCHLIIQLVQHAISTLYNYFNAIGSIVFTATKYNIVVENCLMSFYDTLLQIDPSLLRFLSRNEKLVTAILKRPPILVYCNTSKDSSCSTSVEHTPGEQKLFRL